jgi:NAD(P)H dehydrogenase (quinone)
MIAVTGASGRLGSLAIAGLLKEVPSNRLLALVRSREKAGTFVALGVRVRYGD